MQTSAVPQTEVCSLIAANKNTAEISRQSQNERRFSSVDRGSAANRASRAWREPGDAPMRTTANSCVHGDGMARRFVAVGTLVTNESFFQSESFVIRAFAVDSIERDLIEGRRGDHQ
jgi:hypothetical protein